MHFGLQASVSLGAEHFHPPRPFRMTVGNLAFWENFLKFAAIP
jgi:hypothetical protein